MAKAFIKMPIGLVGTEGPPELACEGVTLRDALADCVTREPRPGEVSGRLDAIVAGPDAKYAGVASHV